MFCRAIAAVLLLSGLYADAQLYGSKRVLVQCVRLAWPLPAGYLATSTVTGGFIRAAGRRRCPLVSDARLFQRL